LGGELFNRIVDKGIFTEEESKYVLQQIGAAVTYLHSKGIAHRDLKVPSSLYLPTS
jgi:calcium/calmodulin-dependent protein kinase I